MKKITFLMCSMGRGGAERVVSILSKHYCGLGWQVDILMLWHNINEYRLDQRIRVLDYSFENEAEPKRIFKMLSSLRNYIKAEKPTVLVPFHAKTSAIFEVASFGLKMKNTRVVVSERIDPYSVNYPSILRYLINKAYQKANVVVFQTERAKSFYSNPIQNKSMLIGNPITMEINGVDDGSHTIINAGRLTKQKNQKMLIEAFSKVAEQFPQYTLEIYGDGELREELKDQIKQLKMETRIALKGNCIDYQERLSQCEIFVLSSDFEGLSNALLEAMRLGKPCITTNCAGSDEIIVDHKNGIITPVGDLNALVNALSEIICNESLREELGKNAEKSSEKFATENVIAQWQNAFEGTK